MLHGKDPKLKFNESDSDDEKETLRRNSLSYYKSHIHSQTIIGKNAKNYTRSTNLLNNLLKSINY
jgi:hypothetical protein